MTVQQTTSNQERAGSWFSYAWHPALILVFLVTAEIGASVLAQRRDLGGPLHGDISGAMLLVGIVTLVLFFVETVGFIVALFRRNLARAVWQALAIAILVASGPQIRWVAQFTNLFLFPSVFAACERNAQPYGSDARFNICNAQSWGNSFDVIVYDSAGEISQPGPQQSQSFKNMLRAQIPLLSECRVFPGHHLHDGFYLVDSDCDQRSVP